MEILVFAKRLAELRLLKGISARDMSLSLGQIKAPARVRELLDFAERLSAADIDLLISLAKKLK